MTDNIPKICAAFEMWQNNDCIGAGTTLELIMRYLADDPEIDHVVSNMDQDCAYLDYIGRQNENLDTKTLIIRDLNKNRTDVLSVSRTTIDNLEAELKTAKSDYEIMRTNCGNTIAKLRDDITVKDRAHNLDMETIQELWGVIHDFKKGYGASRLFVDAVLIRNLNGDNEKLKTTIDELNSQLTEKQAIIDKITLLRVNEVEALYNLKAELSAREEDSAVLMKVVDVANRWSDERIASRPAMNQIAYIVKDYHDAPEGPPETPIDDLYTTRVSVFLEMP